MGWTAADIPSQEGRIALVTGANIGLGYETVRALAARGATVLMACRSRSKAEKARSALLEEGLTGLDLIDLDLADLDDVATAADTVRFTGESMGDLAGWSVGGSGDVNGDGLDDVLVGSPQDDDRGTDAGAAYLFLGLGG